MQVLLVLRPAGAFLVALLSAGTFLERQARDKHEEDGKEDEAEDAAVEGGVGAGVGGEEVIAGWGYSYEEDCFVGLVRKIRVDGRGCDLQTCTIISPK